MKEYCELLDAGLEEAKVGVIPPSLDQVVIGDMERTRIKNIRALFFVGANDTLLPGNAGARGLLSERDRKQFQEKKMNLSPGPKEKIIYSEILSLYESDETVRTSVSVLGKSIRGRKSTSSSVSDPGSDASVPGTCSGRGRQKGTA